MGAERDRRTLHFGVFELHPASGELRKHGVRLRLQDQPFKLLLCLLETPGEIWAREDLIRRIWPEGTFVDYERGLNVAITRLRQVLGDSADTPRYVETVGRKGYRFIAPLEPAAPPEVAVQPQAVPPKKSSPWPYVAVFAIAVAVVAAVGWWRATRTTLQPLARLNVELGRETILAGRGTRLALSPDGTRLAVTVRGADGQPQLATRRLDQNQLTPLSGTEGAESPFFSPDGQWIAFFADSKLKKIAVQGGAPVALSEAFTFRMGPMSRVAAGSWGDDGNIVAMLNPTVGLTRVASAGGSPSPLTVLARAEGELDNWPQVLPGSQAVLFTRLTGDTDYDNGNIEVVSLKTGARKTVLKGGFLGRYLPSGHLVYVHQDTIFAVPFDLGRLATAGVPHRMLDVGGRLGCRNFDFSQTGSFVACQSGNPPLSVFWLDSSGTPLPLQDVPGSAYAGPRFSPDGKRLAFSMTSEGHQDIWVQDLGRGATSRITALPGVNNSPVWTADGRNLIFHSIDQPKPGIYGVRADGSGEAQRLLDLATGDFPYSVSSDGKRLA
jgi:Tol biopolymer transport system component/DNA-binding winged helix-turn-helix (wHTH) protein